MNYDLRDDCFQDIQHAFLERISQKMNKSRINRQLTMFIYYFIKTIYFILTHTK